MMEYFSVIPVELVREILMRVPFASHGRVKEVCKSWNRMLENSEFYEDRRSRGRSEELICLIENVRITTFDPVNQLWGRLPPVPAKFKLYSLSKCVCVKHNLVLLGLRYECCRVGLKRKRISNMTVLVFDFVSFQWSKGADPPITETMFDFACCASPEGDEIYITGGRECDWKSTSQAAVYNVERDEWKLLPNMLQKEWLCSSLFIEGMLYVVCLFDEELQRFDPERGVWSTLPNVWFVQDCVQSIVAAFGRLYCFHWDSVAEFDSTQNLWAEVDALPQPLDRVDAAVFGDDGIFLSGIESDTNDKVLYMYYPPLETGDVNTGRCVSVEIPQYLSHSKIQSVATMTI